MGQVSNPLIPLEINEAILLRLPPQSLARFRWVSKEWNSIISDPKFIKTHQLLHRPKPTKKLLAVSKTTSSLCSIELTIEKNNDTILSTTAKEITLGSPPMSWKDILGSCNGLVLAEDVNGDMFLINPTTHDFWKLPDNPFKPAHAPADDGISMYYGLGYVSSTDDYNVLSVWSSLYPSISYNNSSSTDDYTVVSICNSVSIYSLRNNSWRKLPNTTHDVDVNVGSCALVNGNCHWFAKNSPSVIAFSFVDELFSEIKLPDSILYSNLWDICGVVEIGGKLGVCLFLITGTVELWVMQDYGDSMSWTRVCSHRINMFPVCFLEGSDRDIVFRDAVGVSLFNIDEGRRRIVRIVSGPSKYFRGVGGTFVESIESPKRISTKVMDN